VQRSIVGGSKIPGSFASYRLESGNDYNELLQLDFGSLQSFRPSQTFVKGEGLSSSMSFFELGSDVGKPMFETTNGLPA